MEAFQLPLFPFEIVSFGSGAGLVELRELLGPREGGAIPLPREAGPEGLPLEAGPGGLPFPLDAGAAPLPRPLPLPLGDGECPFPFLPGLREPGDSCETVSLIGT